MIFKCHKCESEIEIEGPYTPRLMRATRLIANPAGSRLMTLGVPVTCPNCGPVHAVYSPVMWIELLLLDLQNSTLVIRSLGQVSLYPKTNTDFNGKPLYQLDQTEIEGLVEFGKITFTQDKSTNQGSNNLLSLHVKKDFTGSVTRGNGNKTKGSIVIKGQKVTYAIIGDGISFLQ